MKYITVQGAPGAGKTTTMKTFMEYLKNKISPTIFRYDDMSTKELAEIVSHQSIEVWITNDNKLAILGRYQSNLKKPELCGADSYTAPQKARLKAIVRELKLRGIELVISEGFGLTNKPYLEQLNKTFEEIDCVVLDVDKSVCFERFKKRNIQMWKRVGDKKRIKEFTNKEEPEWKGSRGEKKIDMILELVKEKKDNGNILKYSSYKEASEYLISEYDKLDVYQNNIKIISKGNLKEGELNINI